MFRSAHKFSNCLIRVQTFHRKAVKEQLRTLGVNDQIKSLVAEKRNYKPTKGKEPGITKEQAIEELKVLHWPILSCNKPAQGKQMNC